jgi:hypothetical protein
MIRSIWVFVVFVSFVGSAVANPNDDKLSAWYRGFSYTCCVPGAAPVAGPPMGGVPVQSLRNPDPEWVPGYAALRITDDAEEALEQAAINRTWSAQCQNDAKRYLASWKSIDATYRPRLDALAHGGNFYERNKAMLQLFQDVDAAAVAAKVVLGDQNAGRYNGLEYDIVTARLELYRQNRRAFLLPVVADAFGKGVVATMGARGRPWLDDASELVSFCMNAELSGALSTPPRPRVTERPPSLRAIRSAIDPKYENQVRANAEQAHASAHASFEIPRVEIVELYDGLATKDEPTLYHVASPTSVLGTVKPLVVTSQNTAGGSTVIELDASEDEPTTYNCYAGEYPGDPPRCQHGERRSFYHLTVTFSDLPADLKIENGDELELWADLEHRQEKAPKNGFNGTFHTQYTLTARHLVAITRGHDVIRP